MWKSCNRIPLALKANSLMVPSPFPRSPSWEIGFQGIDSGLTSKKESGLKFDHSHPGKKPRSKPLKDSKHRETFPQQGDKSMGHPEPIRRGHPWTGGSDLMGTQAPIKVLKSLAKVPWPQAPGILPQSSQHRRHDHPPSPSSFFAPLHWPMCSEGPGKPLPTSPKPSDFKTSKNLKCPTPSNLTSLSSNIHIRLNKW